VIEEPVDPDTLDLENVTEGFVETTDVPAIGVTSFAVQYDSPTATAVTQAETQMRAIPGVRTALTSSLALGGTSVMQVSFQGNLDAFQAALQARGFTVQSSGTTLRITRRAEGQ
jgi:hypothetical protein